MKVVNDFLASDNFVFYKMSDFWSYTKRKLLHFFAYTQKLRIQRDVTAITSPELITLNSEIAFTDVLKFRYRCWIIHIGTGISQAFN